MTRRVEGSEFDRYARAYAELLRDPIRERFAPGSRFFAERKLIVLRRFFQDCQRETRTASWLDVGCGRGELLALGEPYFREAAGCDVSAGMIESCRSLRVRWQESPDRVPFPDGRFDLVTAVCVYHHAGGATRLALAREARRVLRPGGIFCVIEHNPWNPVTRWIVRRSPVDADAHLLTARAARRILRSCGLRVRQTRYFLYFPERVYARLARLETLLEPAPLGGQYAVFAEKA